MFRWRRGRTRGGCIIVPVPCGCLVSAPLLLLGGAALARAVSLEAARNFLVLRATWFGAGVRDAQLCMFERCDLMLRKIADHEGRTCEL